MADRPPLLVPAGVDDVIGHRVSVDHEPGSGDGLDGDIRSITDAVETAVPVDELAARASAAIVATGSYDVEVTERTDDGRRTLVLDTDQGPADVLPHLGVEIAESAHAPGLVEIEVTRTTFDADEVTYETAPSAVRSVLDEIEPQLDGLDATLTGWALDLVISEQTRFDEVIIDAVTDIGIGPAQEVIEGLGWPRSESGGTVIYLAPDYRSWTVSDRGLDVRVRYHG